MADGVVDVVVRFLGDTKQLQGEANKVEGMGSKLKTVGAGLGLAIGGAFAVSQVKDWVGEAEKAQKVSNTLTHTLLNAGDATGAWAKHAETLASKLQDQTGVDDEVIKGGQAVLATFHDVSGAVGQSSGVFDRATQAAVDLAATGIGSVESASLQLGKALQDPIKGMTALARSGVNFTDAQKAQVKALVESGDLLGAQKVILGEVESQVKGTAAASVTSTEKMNAAWGDTKEALGAALLPVLEKVAPLIADLAGFIQQNADVLVPLAGIIGAVVIAQWAWNVAMAANPIGLIVLGVAALVAAIVILIRNWDKVGAAASAAWNWILQSLQGVWNWIKANWPLLLGILTGPFGLAALAIARNWDSIKNGAKAVLDYMTGIASSFYNVGRSWMSKLYQGIVDGAKAVLDKAKDIGRKAIDFLNPFNSPQTRAYYTGQQVVADYIRGIESRQRSAASALAFAGTPTSGKGGGGGRGGVTVNVNGWNGSRVGLGRDVRAAIRAVDRWSR